MIRTCAPIWMVCALATGCYAHHGDSAPDAAPRDAGLRADSGGRDAGRGDAGRGDAGRGDAGSDGGLDAGAVAPPSFVVRAGAHHTCAIVTGRVSCWGHNDDGQLGDGTMQRRSTPALVVGLDDVIELAASWSHTCALRANGTVSCWGANLVGALGRGSREASLSPVAAVDLTDAVEITVGQSYSCARRVTGAVQCWGGYTTRGNSGSGVREWSDVPVAIAGIEDAAQLVGGFNHSCALRSSGRVVCWGGNDSAQLGAPSRSLEGLTPVPVALRGVLQLAAGGDRTCARLEAGGIACWGDGFEGIERLAPAVEAALGDVVELAVGFWHVCGRDRGGAVRCWGGNGYGQLGDGSTEDRSVPVLALEGASGVTAGVLQSCAASEFGVRCWGGNRSGQLGDGTTDAQLTPVEALLP